MQISTDNKTWMIDVMLAVMITITDIYSRLFIVCPKSVTRESLTEAFSEFGTIENIKLPHDHITL